ncbi:MULTISPECIES: TonB-dependent receptor [unclassified Spirosoma]|uniref:TonB-dependent receptor n=1 Tax=unclassified Spirosoma TaxID=2621999 RepID=UPI00095ED305|nr:MULTISPECIES: TonB-dependent receptor [unclassified Spirosoma]MBN8825655.1 TonB-dependent receptor [Spirosoma sp.]OJW71645.1 MAG: TonB-dependent receptor [Spirosoma sp. 48-14]
MHRCWKLSVVLVGLAVGSHTLWAQTIACQGSVQGKILANENQQPLVGATVYVRELKTGATTDTTGIFRLSALCKGQYTVEYQYIGYKSVSMPIVVNTDSTLILQPVQLVADSRTLQEVVISEHRSEAQQLLQTQSSLSGAALDQTRGQSLGESLKTLTGLYSIQTGPSISKPVIHGLYSNRIIILNNGIRQEDQQWGTEHAPQVDQFLASRLTVIKGAASIRYGSDAIGGVILVEPKSMPTRPGVAGEINLVGATNGGLGVVSGLIEGAFAKKLPGLSWRLQGTLKRSGYVRTPNYYLENTSYHETNFSGDLHYDHRRWGTEVFYSQFDTKIGLFTGAQVSSLADLYAAIQRPEPLVKPGFSYDLSRPYQDVQHDLLKVRSYWHTGRGGELTATYAWQQNQRREYDYVSFSGALTPELYLKLVSQSVDLVWEQAPVKSKAGGQWSGSIGFNGLTQGNIRQYLFLIPNFRNYGAGLFAIERYAVGNWTLEAGLRYDYRWLRAYFLDDATKRTYAETHNWQNVNGSLGLACELRSDLTVTANLSTAWRAPNVADLYSNGLHQSAVAYERGNPNLRPEQALNGNLVLAYAGKRLSGEVGVYNNLINNYIYLKPDSVPIIRQRGAFPAYTYTQVRATFRGLDASLTYKLTDRLALTTKNSLLFAYNQTEHAYLVFIPPNRSDNSLRYEWPKWGSLSNLYLSLSGLYVARQNRAPAVTTRQENGQIIFTGDFAAPPPAYFLVGAELGFAAQVGQQTMTVSLSGTNLANVAYRDYLNRFRYFADEPGRSIMIRIKLPLTSSKGE